MTAPALHRMTCLDLMLPFAPYIDVPAREIHTHLAEPVLGAGVRNGWKLEKRWNMYAVRLHAPWSK